MCDGMAFVMHKMPRKIKHLIGGHLKQLSENELASLRLYANAHLNTHPFVNNIPVPEELKTYDLDYVKNQLLSGLKDKVEWNFYDNEDIEF